MIQLIEPWTIVDSSEKEKLMEEYSKEIHQNHILFDEKLELIGRRQDRDDILFYLLEKEELAIVHLTWSGKRESDNWPSTDFQSVKDFINEMMEENKLW